ncbi:MAG: dihydrofolate reductase [Pseudomarimonas sp.]
MVLIAALDCHRAIGRDNSMPWHLPDDLKRFKALTLGHPILMGRKTAQSLGRVLPGRLNLVLTRQAITPVSGMQVVGSLDEARSACGDAQTLFVIGGGEIYTVCLQYAEHMYLTHVDTMVEGADAFFPDFEASQWQIEASVEHPADSRHPHAFRFVDYRRTNR